MSVEARSAQIGRLVRTIDFERVLNSRSRYQSVHFALHHLAGTPSVGGKPRPEPVVPELSTGGATMLVRSVDDSPPEAPAEALVAVPTVPGPRLWLGAVVPKRHARRAVTRTLLKRQIRAAVGARAGSMPAGLWVVRLRAEFDRATYPSAASSALRRAVRVELDSLLDRTFEPDRTAH